MNNNEKKDILRAFYSFNMWHIRSIYTQHTHPYFTASDEEEMFNVLRGKGFELLCADGKFFYFK